MGYKGLKSSVDHLLASWIKPHSLVLNQWVGQSKPSHSKLVLFAHFDPQGVIDPYVLYYLQCLHQLKTDIIFVSTSENLLFSEVEKALPYCTQVIQRKNISLDFGSWKIGLLNTPRWEHYDQVILANDSVYGPLFPLEDSFLEMEKRDLDLWGITRSFEIQEHLQSYFLVLRNNVLKSLAFRKFWEDFKFLRGKGRIIQNYEIGFSQLAQKQNWKTGAVIESFTSGKNPTLYEWDTLVEKFRCPFLKTEVLKLNRTQSPNVVHWREVVSSASTYPIQLIESHLKRIRAI